jgi:hypothetical protein
LAENIRPLITMSIAIGTRFGRYEAQRTAWRWQHGEVYLARDTKLDRKVAIKLLPAEFTTNDERLRRFEKEACAASALNHPNIRRVGLPQQK